MLPPRSERAHGNPHFLAEGSRAAGSGDGRFKGCSDHALMMQNFCIPSIQYSATHERSERCRISAMNSSDHKRQVGRNLSLLCQAIGSTDAEIARSVGVSNSKLGNWKRGDNYIDPYVATQLCDRYGVTMDWIFRGKLYGLPKELADKISSLMVLPR
jgi:hypothetical protein